MITKTIYVAFDGKQFDDEYKCTNYELSEHGKNVGNDLLMYDKNGKQIFVKDYRFGDIDYDYVIFKSKQAYDCFALLMDYCEYTYPNEEKVKDDNDKCSYYYDYDYEAWRNINDKINELQSQIDKLSKYLVKED